MDLHSKLLMKLAIFRYGGFEFEAVSEKWLHTNSKKSENTDKGCLEY